MDPHKGLNAWMVGVSIPILFAPQHSRNREAKYELAMARWEEQENRMNLSNKVESLRINLMQQKQMLDYYKGYALPEAENLKESALLRLLEGDVDMVEASVSLDRAREILSAYLQAIYDYNVTILELELYTE